MKKMLLLLMPALLSSLLLSGCTTTVTNLTPSTQKRNANGLYPFEVIFDTTEQCIRKETVAPYVLIGSQMYPMQPTMLLKNRWETLAPIPADREYVSYQYKFNYEYNAIPSRGRSSKLSPPFQLQILDR
jgi:hypothetical protein